MGVKISIDKHISELDDVLEMSPHYLSRVQFESRVSPDITHHLKVSLNNYRSGASVNLVAALKTSNVLQSCFKAVTQRKKLSNSKMNNPTYFF
jgi:hypothetical protein